MKAIVENLPARIFIINELGNIEYTDMFLFASTPIATIRTINNGKVREISFDYKFWPKDWHWGIEAEIPEEILNPLM